jgi:hypothetical protein
MKLERRVKIGPDDFVQCLSANVPLIAGDGMANWTALSRWTPEFFVSEFGNDQVQVYDDLFDLIDVCTLRKFIADEFNRKDNKPDTKHPRPYVRWYSKFADKDFCWADTIFAKLRHDWALPYFIPSCDYLLPFCSSRSQVDPTIDYFPAKGLFLSGAGAETRLHQDPWASDAVLCQIYGSKSITLYPPGTEPKVNGRASTPQHEPDNSSGIQASLSPGDIILLPHGWYHRVVTVSDSISLTWNFVHSSTWQSYFRYLTSGPTVKELETIRFFLKHSRG